MNIDDIIDATGTVCDFCNLTDDFCLAFCHTECGYMYLVSYNMILDGKY